MKFNERAIASWLILLLGKLTNWNFPRGGEGPGDPAFLTAEQAGQLAAAGIRLLTPMLPSAAAQQVEAALKQVPQVQSASIEEMLVNVGGLGGVVHHGSGGAPGCCVMINGRLVCVRASSD
jgi:hypothetical protein